MPNFLEDRERIVERAREHLIRLEALVAREYVAKFRDLIAPERLSEVVNPSRRVPSNRVVSIRFERAFEDRLFWLIFSSSPTVHMYHYTSLDAAFHILKSRRLRLSSIVGLNDRGELTFADSLIGRASPDALDPVRLREANNRYVFSCSTGMDDLNQWRLYGGDGKGACLEFAPTGTFDYSRDFALGKVIYGDTLYTILANLWRDLWQNLGFRLSYKRLHVWENFVKASDWQYEREVRLLYVRRPDPSRNDRTWAVNSYNILSSYVEIPIKGILPLQLISIRLGPKVPEIPLNLRQFERFAGSVGHTAIGVSKSEIDCYR